MGNKKNDVCNQAIELNTKLCFECNKKEFQLIFNDHGSNTTKIIETLKTIPKKEELLEYIIEKSFNEPIRSILLQ